MRQIAFTSPQTATVVDVPDSTEPLQPDEVRGRTLVSLISPGTELNSGFLGTQFPNYPGYACAFEVEEVGAEVRDITVGTVVFSSSGHSEKQRRPRREVIPLPAGLVPEIAVFARLAGVTMSTLNTTTARPPSHVLVTGLGPVGNLAAQIFSSCGYQVTAVDPTEARRESARKVGLRDVRDFLANGPVDLSGKFALHIECSGHEQAVLDGCRAVRKRGEVVLVGVPWIRRTDNYASDLLHAVFHKYAVIRSGWEWEVPVWPTEFSGNSISENLAAAMRWLAEGRISASGLGSLYAPSQAQEVYAGLLAQSLPTPAALFDWR